jgi:hypothetical protein
MLLLLLQQEQLYRSFQTLLLNCDCVSFDFYFIINLKCVCKPVPNRISKAIHSATQKSPRSTLKSQSRGARDKTALIFITTRRATCHAATSVWDAGDVKDPQI